MANVGAVVSSIRNIMRQDRGISGDAQRLEQLGWMLFLKIIDDKDQELEILKDNYVSVVPEKFQWRTWASDPEGITGDELLEFIDSNAESNRGLFASLRNLTSITNPKRASIVKEVFDGSNNYMKSGYEMRKVINKLNEVDFNNSDDKHVFGDIYESILVELRDAGNKGEYYTPRAVTQLMTQMIDPKLKDRVLDPAAGTGGFLTAAIDHVRDNYVNTVDDEHILQNNITGWELKPVAYVLGLTNLILHEMDIPDYHYMDSLKREYNSIGKKDQVDVILANPPFGASIADGVETNFPTTYRCKESADLFVILMLQLLKSNGRCAIVLPDGSITGDGIKSRIREKLLTDTNLHTIVRLPQTTFFPALVNTNLLFFEKGNKTKDIWFYEHNLPKGQKSYSKTKPIKFEEFNPLIKWWNNREENEQAWKVNVTDLKNWDLDVKNPNIKEDVLDNSSEYLSVYSDLNKKIVTRINEISDDLNLKHHTTLKVVLDNHTSALKELGMIKLIRQSILQEAIKGNLTKSWREDNSTDNSAIELLRLTQENKNKLIAEGKIRKERTLTKLNMEDMPFRLPDNWEWCKLEDIAIINGGFAFKSSQYKEKGIRVIRISDFDGGGFKNDKIVRYDFSNDLDAYILEEKNILMAMTGGTVGKSLFVEAIDEPMAVNQRVATIKILEPINAAYINCVIPTSLIQDVIQEAKNSTNDNISMSNIKGFLIPLPPLDEQLKIVLKANELLDKCTELEPLLEKYHKTSKLLIKSSLLEMFSDKGDSR